MFGLSILTARKKDIVFVGGNLQRNEREKSDAKDPVEAGGEVSPKGLHFCER